MYVTEPQNSSLQPFHKNNTFHARA